MASSDIIAAIATAPGRSGIGVVRVSGARLGPMVESIVGRRLPARRAVLAAFCDTSGVAIDQGIALFFPAPSFMTSRPSPCSPYKRRPRVIQRNSGNG